jgi:PST family polysaccharide transporter
MSVSAKAVQGVAWNLATGVGARIVQLIGTLVLTRFIAPAEYGEISATAVCVLTLSQVFHFNFGQYLIAKRASPEVTYQSAVLHVSLGVIGMGIVLLLRQQLAAWFDVPGLARFLPGFAIAAVLDRVAYTPERMLTRDLRFRNVAVIRGLGELTFTATALALAPRYGGMGIVAGHIARSTLVMTLFIRTAPRQEWLVPTRLQPKVARELLLYGLPITISALAEIAASRWDNMLVARFFGPAVLGAYSLAYSLADTPIGYVAEHIGDVLMPSFSKMEHDQRRAAVVRAAGLMGLIVFPLGVGLGAVSYTVVHTFFDARWAGMAPMLTLLSVGMVFRPMSWPAGALLQAQQRTRPIMVLSFFHAVALLGLIGTIGRLNPLWACIAVGLTTATSTVATLFVVERLEAISMWRSLLEIVRPLLACVPLYFAVTGVRDLLTHFGLRSGVVSLLFQVPVGAIAYVVAAFVIAGPTARDLIRLVREALGRRRDAR